MKATTGLSLVVTALAATAATAVYAQLVPGFSHVRLPNLDAPSYLIDWLKMHVVSLAVWLVAILLAWTLIPYLIAKRLQPPPATRVDRETMADRYRGMITKIIAVPLLIVPFMAYVDGYLKNGAQILREADERFEDRYKKNAELISSTSEIAQIMGLQGMRRLLGREDSDRKERQRIVQALAASVSVLSPRQTCNPAKRLSMSAQIIVDIFSDYHQENWPASFTDACLRGVSMPPSSFLAHVDFSNSDISGGDFYAARLIEANLRFANLSGSSFLSADFSAAGLYCTTGEKSKNIAVASQSSRDPVSMNASEAKASDTTINRSSLVNAYFSNAKFTNGEIKDSCLNDANLYTTTFANVHIRNVNFGGANAAGASFENSKLFDVSFDGANLNSATFGGARLERVSFKGADLSGTHFEAAVLVDTSFNGAKLCDTHMPGGKVEKGDCMALPQPQPSSNASCSAAIKKYCSPSGTGISLDR